jgi:hypothetical protein
MILRRHAQDDWKQEQMFKLEGFAILKHLILIQDEIEQANQIEALQQLKEQEKEEKEENQRKNITQLQQWEEQALIIQQKLNSS